MTRDELCSECRNPGLGNMVRRCCARKTSHFGCMVVWVHVGGGVMSLLEHVVAPHTRPRVPKKMEAAGITTAPRE